MSQAETTRLAEGDGQPPTEHLRDARDAGVDESPDRARTVRNDDQTQREHAKSDRLQAADGDVHLAAHEAATDRAAAASDRQCAAEDRKAAAALRAAAARDRRLAERERRLAGIDQLTGVSLRGVGLGEIKREIARAHRTHTPLVLAFVDVNNLKAVNDGHGHLAGDAVLRQVAETLRAKLRPYDVIMRFGGDEFVCALPHLDADDARGRFADIIQTLEASGFAAPISFGVAELQEDDDLEGLLARADHDLMETRRISGHDAKRDPG